MTRVAKMTDFSRTYGDDIALIASFGCETAQLQYFANRRSDYCRSPA